MMYPSPSHLLNLKSSVERAWKGPKRTFFMNFHFQACTNGRPQKLIVHILWLHGQLVAIISDRKGYAFVKYLLLCNHYDYTGIYKQIHVRVTVDWRFPSMYKRKDRQLHYVLGLHLLLVCRLRDYFLFFTFLSPFCLFSIYARYALTLCRLCVWHGCSFTTHRIEWPHVY